MTAAIMKTVQGYGKLSSVNYHKLSICCSDVLLVSDVQMDNRKVEETSRKVIKDTIQEMLPSIMKTALEQPNLGELSRTITNQSVKLSH